jgi:soluble calcium-activated nucleotidase 1
MAARSLEIVVIADLDKQSKDETTSSLTFFSFLQHGTLTIAKSSRTRRSAPANYAISWGGLQRVTTEIHDGERGFELSELAWFQGKLLTFDDRTGTVFELSGFTGQRGRNRTHRKMTSLQAVPQRAITEGDGAALVKGQKHEWATVKDGELYMGSNGLVTTDNDGSTKRVNEWVAVLDAENTVRRVDWGARYARVREALRITPPGYVTHEAVEWSSVHNKWVLLPRRVSADAFDESLDEHRGAHKLILASDDFQQIEVVEIQGPLTPERGFSSFKFVPHTDDTVLVAIKSVELGDAQESYLTVLDIQGNVLLADTKLPGDHKYEGVAFAQDWARADAAGEVDVVASGCCGSWWS